MKTLTKISAIALATALTAACSTIPTIPMEERVIARSDGLSETPKWATYGVGSFVEKGNISFVGNHDVGIGSSLSMACRVAASKAKNDISSEIYQKLSFVLQHAEEGMNMGAGQTKYIGGEVSKLTTSSIRYDGCYWEQVMIPTGEQSFNTIYRIFAKVSIPKDKLEEAIRKAGKGKFSQEFTKQVSDHWANLVGGNDAVSASPVNDGE